MIPGDREPVLRGPRLLLRPVHPDDIQALVAILTEPDVARWWGRYDTDRVREELCGFAIVNGGMVGGWLMVSEECDPDYRHVGFDIALTSARQGRGYGPEGLRLAIEHFIGRGHHRFTIDPAADNERAIRAYQAVGFRPVGVMRAYERGGDGRWHDNLLMDLLAAEFSGQPVSAARPARR